MTIVIITHEPRPEWNGLNTKRFVYDKDFENVYIDPSSIILENGDKITDENWLQLELTADEITSITITY